MFFHTRPYLWESRFHNTGNENRIGFGRNLLLLLELKHRISYLKFPLPFPQEKSHCIKDGRRRRRSTAAGLDAFRINSRSICAHKYSFSFPIASVSFKSLKCLQNSHLFLSLQEPHRFKELPKSAASINFKIVGGTKEEKKSAPFVTRSVFHLWNTTFLILLAVKKKNEKKAADSSEKERKKKRAAKN